jgi:hypothetical protein
MCRECKTPLPVQSTADSNVQTPTAAPLPTTSETAIASLVCGLLGWTVIPVVGSVLAIVLGYIAKGQIARSAGQRTGNELATAGRVLGYVSLGVAVVGALIALPFGLACGLCAAF